jgi:hypothetical protein
MKVEILGFFGLGEVAFRLQRTHPAMQKTLVDPYELRQDLFGDEVEVEVEIEEEPVPSAKTQGRMLKILTPTKPIRPWLSEEQ